MAEDQDQASISTPEGSSLSYDQLDRLVRVTTIQGWVYLGTLFGVCVAAIAFAVVYRVPTKVVGEGILLIERDTLAQVRASAMGRLVSLNVKLGDIVAPGDQIGEISQDELKDAIHEAEAKLRDARGEDEALTRFEQQERETQRRPSTESGARFFWRRAARATSCESPTASSGAPTGFDRRIIWATSSCSNPARSFM